MSEEQNGENGKGLEDGDGRKRRRTPSQYASRIADFKNVRCFPSRITLLSPKKLRTTKATKATTTITSLP